jgi:pSer/pThr/pTyr-binding forkhead associated (FHA) protein
MRLALRWTDDGEDILLPLPSHGSVRIGRDDACDVVVSDITVSRVHAEILMRDGAPVVRHLSATNPTYLNGEIMVGEAPLHLGDELWVPVRVIHVTALHWPGGDPSRPTPERGASP